MPIPEKDVLYQITETYLQSRVDTWRLDRDKPATCELTGVARQKRDTCLNILSSINDSHTYFDWINVCYKLASLRQEQHKRYESGLTNKARPAQGLIKLIDDLHYIVLGSIQDEKFVKDYIGHLNNKYDKEKSDEPEKNSPPLFGLMNAFNKPAKPENILEIENSLKALSLEEIPTNMEKLLPASEHKDIVNKCLTELNHHKEDKEEENRQRGSIPIPS